MRFVVVGTGGVGAYVGGRLAAAGERVTLVGRDAVLDPIRASGLEVSALDGFVARVRPQALRCVASCAEAAAEGRDGAVLLLTVKGSATAAAAAEAAAAFSAGTLLVSLQNGVDNVARARAAAPKLDVVAGMVPFNLAWLAPDRVRRATDGSIFLESARSVPRVAATFARAGLDVALSSDMPGVAWGKLLINLNNPVNALSGVTLREEFAQRGYRRAWASLLREGLAATRAAGIVPARVLPVGPAALARVLELPDPVFRVLARRLSSIDPAARSSMADDFAKGRSTEIDDLCGAIVRLGAERRVPTPANAAMVRLVENFDGRFLGGAELFERLRAS